MENMACLEAANKFKGSDEPQTPIALLWCYYYLASHFNKTGDFETALSFIEKALLHTPTFIEAYLIKG